MEAKFILKPGLKSAYCNLLDKHIYQDGLVTDDQKVIGELCLTPGVYLLDSKQYKEMIKEQERIKLFIIDRDKKEAEAKIQAELQAKAELVNMSEADKAQREANKPTGAEKAKVDEIRHNLEKEIALESASKPINKKEKRK